LNDTTTTNDNNKTASLKELLTDSSAKDCEIFFVTKRRSFEVIVDTITKKLQRICNKKEPQYLVLILVNNSFGTPQSANTSFLFKILNPLRATNNKKITFVIPCYNM